MVPILIHTFKMPLSHGLILCQRDLAIFIFIRNHHSSTALIYRQPVILILILTIKALLPQIHKFRCGDDPVFIHIHATM